MIVVSSGESEPLAKSIAKQLKITYSALNLTAFPDGELYLKFNVPVKGKKVIIVKSFQPHPDMSLFDIVFIAETARQLGAKKVILVAPYLGYMRQDKQFHPGECVSSRVMAKLLNNSVDKLITIDPHLHRYRSLKEIFTIPAIKLTANSVFADYIKKNFSNELIIGPDWESYQWAREIAKTLHVEATVLKKERFSSRQVKVRMVQPVIVRGKNVIIVDDIVSTGHTAIEAMKQARKLGAKSVSVLAVHGLFVEKALEKMKQAGIATVLSTNCIPGKTAKIDVSALLVGELRKEK